MEVILQNQSAREQFYIKQENKLRIYKQKINQAGSNRKTSPSKQCGINKLNII